MWTQCNIGNTIIFCKPFFTLFDDLLTIITVKLDVKIWVRGECRIWCAVNQIVYLHVVIVLSSNGGKLPARYKLYRKEEEEHEVED